MRHSKTEQSLKKKPKTNVPKSFIAKIKSLGLKEEDAEVLYETKIDWTAVYSDNKIYCTEGGEQKCDFVAEMRTDNVDLRNQNLGVTEVIASFLLRHSIDIMVFQDFNQIFMVLIL